MSIPMCVIQTSNFIAQHVACKNKYRNKYLDYVRLGNKTHLFACKDLYEKLMHFMHLECTCIGRKSLHIFEHAFPSVLVKNFIFRGMFIDVYYFVCTQSLFSRFHYLLVQYYYTYAIPLVHIVTLANMLFLYPSNQAVSISGFLSFSYMV